MAEHPVIESAETVGSGLVTLAFITAWSEDAQYKTGRLDFLLPMIAEVIKGYGGASFSVLDVKESVRKHFGIALPSFVVSSLLRIACSYHYVDKYGDKRYCMRFGAPIPVTNIEEEAKSLQSEQNAFLVKLSSYALERKLCRDDAEVQRAFSAFLLANSPILGNDTRSVDDLEDSWIARYIARFHRGDDACMSMLVSLMRGALLYNAVFLPELRSQKSALSMEGIEVFLDTPVVMEALGFDGPDQKAYALESIKQFAAAGARVSVFEDTINEVDSILYSSLKEYDNPEAIARYKTLRHIREEGIGKKDLALKRATLEPDLESLGMSIVPRPLRIKEYVAHEESLYAQLADSNGVSDTPRVKHDVDCVSAILTLRGSSEPRQLSRCRAVLVSTASSTVRSVGKWWYGHEHRQSLPPMMSLVKVANYAWLSTPHSTEGDLQRLALIATCSAALEPSAQTLEKFTSQVAELGSRGMTRPQVHAVLVTAAHSSALLDQEEDVLVGKIDEVDAKEVFDKAIEELTRGPAEQAAIAAREEQRLIDDESLRAIKDELDKSLRRQDEMERQLERQREIQEQSEKSMQVHEDRVALVINVLCFGISFMVVYACAMFLEGRFLQPIATWMFPGDELGFDLPGTAVSLATAVVTSCLLKGTLDNMSKAMARKLVRG